ncbi:isocitrate lyase/PEP mutase family protein [Pseudorhodoferax sp.]|uniref:isocitrate lyase/PEP mutase family protein n=1 Tax=Pseudorhodoferax sp. TaxID=1993553 RepID=UPI002DD6639F|nr:isocitrate lyase/phosphoenolpyruvate mutase family protein [Pseudorhodoferax sp.]
MPNPSVHRFRQLHEAATPLLLPNAWDGVSARLFEAAGARAIATTSAGLAWALGYADGRALPAEEAIGAATRIVRVLQVPLSIDIENGYADDPRAVAALAQQLVDTGVAGINIEDGRDAPELLAAKIDAVRNALAKAGADLFVNARTDVFLAGLAEPAARVAETLRRAALYAGAGADGLFVPGLCAREDIQDVAAATRLPLNVMAWAGLPDAAGLAGLGVRRLSAGSAIAQRAAGFAQRTAKAFLDTGASDALLADAMPFAEMQQLLRAA